MAFTTTDERRLLVLEAAALELSKKLSGAASMNQLNRVLIVAEDDLNKLEEQMDALEVIMEEILDLTRKLQ